MTSTNREILWMLKQMQSTIGNIKPAPDAQKLTAEMAVVFNALGLAIQAFQQAIVTAEETKDETITAVP